MRRDIIPILLLAALPLSCKAKHAGPGTDASAISAAPTATAPAAAAPFVLSKDELAPFESLPDRYDSDANPITPDKVVLGRMLFYEPRLSKDKDVSCNSCHDLALYGVDGAPTSTGHRGQHGGRNAPTVYNAGGHVAQFWDGRALTVEAQAKGPVLNPVEMAMPNEKAVVGVLKSIPEYTDRFRRAFPEAKDPVTFDNMARAIGAFERQLVTPSRFDKLLGGDATALSDGEKRGLDRFVSLGCPSCHYGSAVGGATFQKLGLVNAYPDQHDQGRYGITKQEGDRMVFRVPSLRNVAQTAPYMHDGSVAGLDEVVRRMGHHQLGVELTEEDVSLIVQFLGSLTGQIPADYIQKPKLPQGPTG